MDADPVDLDLASAAPWHPAALQTYVRVAQELPGDPQRRHTAGRAASDLLEGARAAVATSIGASADRLVFTSGGTEAVHLAVLGSAAANRTRPRRIISTAVEHSAVLAAARATDHEHVVVGVDPEGRIDLEALEVGTIQPLAEVAARCRAHDVLLHVDACQTVGRLPVDLAGLDADMVSCSAAKFGGGRGTGAMAWSHRARFRPLLDGDSRERRRRAGLEHLPGIAAMAEALLQHSPSAPDGPAAAEATRADELRRRLRETLVGAVADLAVHGPVDASLPHLVAFSALYVEGEALVQALDVAGYAVHSGSSCATTSGEPSHVLVAMAAMTHGHVRVAFGPEVGARELDGFVTALSDVVAELRGRLPR